MLRKLFCHRERGTAGKKENRYVNCKLLDVTVPHGWNNYVSRWHSKSNTTLAIPLVACILETWKGNLNQCPPNTTVSLDPVRISKKPSLR